MTRTSSVNTATWLGAAVIAATVFLASPALANDGWNADVPNGDQFGCFTCHSIAPALNDFGIAVQTALSADLPDWTAVYNLDSDSDGQTNGQELGDPCGSWTKGAAAPRTTDISNPGDDSSTSADPDNPSCGGTGGATSTGAGSADTPDDDDDSAGCAVTTRRGSGAASFLALLALGSVLIRRRRRR